MDVSKIITALLAGMREISASETVVGAPIRSGDTTIIPVSKVTLGFGTGTAGSRNETPSGVESSAIGGGLSVDPQAFIVVDGEGRAQLLSLKDSRSATVLRAIELLPSVLRQLGLPLPEASSASAALPSDRDGSARAENEDQGKQQDQA
ncbi:MAG TPA: spore germination protein GerW family protein [Candidatus Binatia bacterium]